MFGENQEHANKIVYPLEDITVLKPTSEFNIPFSSEVFKNVFKANRDCESISIKMNTEGLLKIDFESEDVKSHYYIVRRQDY